MPPFCWVISTVGPDHPPSGRSDVRMTMLLFRSPCSAMYFCSCWLYCTDISLTALPGLTLTAPQAPGDVVDWPNIGVAAAGLPLTHPAGVAPTPNIPPALPAL